jgi:hypothetical protein
VVEQKYIQHVDGVCQMVEFLFATQYEGRLIRAGPSDGPKKREGEVKYGLSLFIVDMLFYGLHGSGIL